MRRMSGQQGLNVSHGLFRDVEVVLHLGEVPGRLTEHAYATNDA